MEDFKLAWYLKLFLRLAVYTVFAVVVVIIIIIIMHLYHLLFW